jgi:hypothetical protein
MRDILRFTKGRTSFAGVPNVMEILEPTLLIRFCKWKALNKIDPFGTKFGVVVSGPKSVLSFDWWTTKKS